MMVERNLIKKQNLHHNWENVALVLSRRGRGQGCNVYLGCSGQVLWFKVLALNADGPGLLLQHYGMEAGEAGGYISFDRLEILA